jgi:hypothetical protein
MGSSISLGYSFGYGFTFVLTHDITMKHKKYYIEML